MPILLDDVNEKLTTSTPVKVFSPKFFDEKLTGKGGSSTTGVLSANAHPIAVPANQTTYPMYYQIVNKKSTRNGDTRIHQIPINPLPYDVYDSLRDLPTPDLNELTLIGEDTANHTRVKLYVDMQVTAITIEETTTNGDSTHTTRKVTPAYQLFFYKINKDNRVKTVYVKYSTNPLYDWNTAYAAIFTNDGYTLDDQKFIDMVSNFDTYDSIAHASEIWQTSIDQKVEFVLTHLTQNQYQTPLDPSKGLSKMGIKTICNFVRYLMNYPIPLELYKNIYASLYKYFPMNTKEICKQNLNLLLSSTLNHLSDNKKHLSTFHAPNNIILPPSMTKLSTQQINAVKCEDPLILVQAGAGTGKSTLILSRIDYLIASGVKANDITVLSFTNAAADNITAKNPNVNSMTIARMIHNIYTDNYTGHELSSLDTIFNSLDIYYPPKTRQNTIVDQFSRHIQSMIKNEPNSFINMNNFIEEHFDKIIHILNTIHQTSLELEIIICYQKIDVLNEPASVQNKFLIIDEVQDNSVFEFIYTLKYIDKHQQSMFIVGDCSQTLYEFRASNPRALNILEGSGTFKTFQLTTNYRSNQEILDMANIMLQTIEANQYAKIQLYANSRAKVTEQSFLEKVHFHYERLPRITQLHEKLPFIFAKHIHNYIADCLVKNEQIAILAFTRKDVARIQDILMMQYPDANIASLVPKRMYNSTVISTFIKNYWNTIQFAPSLSIINLIIQSIMLKLPYITYNSQKFAPMVRDMLNRWERENHPIIQGWVNQFLNGQMTQDKMLHHIKQNLLQFEIATNAMKQTLLSSKNQQNKQADCVQKANFVLSTIHSAKGLEFDHVIVLYKNENPMDEDKKRMYYVALTRAMKSEYILAYDTKVVPQIAADYLTVVKELHKQSPAPNSLIN